MPISERSSFFKRQLNTLVQRYHRKLTSGEVMQMDEAALRNDFLDPFWRALGWDLENSTGLPQSLRDVEIETRVHIQGRQKRADYLFRTDGVGRFICEAKRPGELSRLDAYQAQRYAFNLSLYPAILSNFGSLRLYIVGGKPDQSETFPIFQEWPYNSYLERADELYDMLSQEKVASGSFDALIRTLKKKPIKGKDRQGWLWIPERTRTVDAEFLDYIEEQRVRLAKDLLASNPKFAWSIETINESIQRILDRILFVRICEDRDIDTGRPLDLLLSDWQQTLGQRPPLYPRLVAHFNALDQSFNGALFKSGHISEKLKISDELLVDLITDLSSEDSPYLFNTLPVEVLGSVYERFIGSTVTLTATGNLRRTEYRPEIKKSQGVFYTPRHIVDEIVEETVGVLISGAAPKEIAAMRFLDPACGSGSFLLRVFERVCDEYRTWFRAHPADCKGDMVYTDEYGVLHLTTYLKRRIMLNNIFGVDLDHQAVEVTMLSLYLKILEGETRTSLGKQQGLFPKETFLPDLTQNIKCGNSLVEKEAKNSQSSFFASDSDGDDDGRFSPFNWSREFPKIIKTGGFDAIVGNPPYVRIQALNDSSPRQAEYLKRHYRSAAKGNYDIYVVFVERSLFLLKKTGRLGFILPSKFFATDYGAPLRKLLVELKCISSIVDFKHHQIFETATTYTCLLFLSRMPVENLSYSVTDSAELGTSDVRKTFVIPTASLGSSSWTFGSPTQEALIRKLLGVKPCLLDMPTEIARGSSTGADDIFMLSSLAGKYLDRNGSEVAIEEELLRVPIFATDFSRYRFNPVQSKRVIFPYKVEDGGSEPLTETQLKRDYPGAYEYLRSKKRDLAKRKGHSQWFLYSAPRNLPTHDSADCLVPLLANRGSFASITHTDMSRFCLMAGGGFSISNLREGFSSQVMIGVLNSRVMFWLLQRISNIFRGGWVTCTKQYVGRLPMPTIEGTVGDEIASLVSKVEHCYLRLESPMGDHEKARNRRLLLESEDEIDELCYELFDITERERSCISEQQECAREVTTMNI